MQLPSRRTLTDLASGLVPWAVGAFLALAAIEELSSPTLRAVGVGLAILQGAALHWRSRHPERVTLVVLLAGLAYQLLVPEVVLPLAGFFAVGSLAAARPPRVSLLGLLGLVALAATNLLTTTVEDSVFTIGISVGAWALGEAARNRRLAIEESARRAAAEERARIARELHDVIAHSVSVIVVQAGAADHLFEERPDQARDAVRAIEATGRETQQELRRLLAVVRPDADVGSIRPQPGLDRLSELAVPLRAAGLRVDLRLEGSARALPAGVDLSAYRIVQEALTNTLRHAAATRAEVTVRYEEDAVEVSVVDDGRGGHPASPDHGGYGIAGMRERVATLGGTIEAGPLPGGGFCVRASLPLEAAQ